MSQMIIPGTQVVVAKEVNGIEMGILDDGTTYIAGRALARLCGVAESTIREARDRWNEGGRTGPLQRFLVNAGVMRERLSLEATQNNQTVSAYTEDVALALLSAAEKA